MLRYHLIAFTLAFFLDQMIGDPHQLPHPIRYIGNLITKLQYKLYPKEREQAKERRRGTYLVILVVTIVTAMVGAFYLGSYALHPIIGIVVESILTFYIFATKSLKDESMKVYDRLKTGTLEEARKAVSMIVGRDTTFLDEKGVAKAAIETVAENASDGVIAPMFYAAIGGPVLGYFYKAVNTMDSMIGYKNDKYMHFGRVAAKLDDVMNYVPARLSAWLMIIVAYLSGKAYSGKRAYFVYKRDRRKHASPNAAQTEAACAGALGIQLAGDAYYFGKLVKKEYLGDSIRAVEYEDIRRINVLMYKMSYLFLVICVIFLWCISK